MANSAPPRAPGRCSTAGKGRFHPGCSLLGFSYQFSQLFGLCHFSIHGNRVNRPACPFGRSGRRAVGCLSSLYPAIMAVLARRAVAQLGSAREWGSRGPGFKSRQPDRKRRPARICGAPAFSKWLLCMEGDWWQSSLAPPAAQGLAYGAIPLSAVSPGRRGCLRGIATAQPGRG